MIIDKFQLAKRFKTPSQGIAQLLLEGGAVSPFGAYFAVAADNCVVGKEWLPGISHEYVCQKELLVSDEKSLEARMLSQA